MADRIPVLVDPWLGQVFRSRDGELTGSIEVEPAVRAPRKNGIGGGTGAERPCGLVRCRVPPGAGQAGLDQAVRGDHAPEGQAAQYAPQPGTVTDLLFLDGFEADLQGRISLVFDFGDLDQLVVRLD